MKIKNQILIVVLALFCLVANAEYAPPISIGTSKESYVVNSDASVIQISESFIKIESQSGVDTKGKRSFSYNSKLENVEVLEAYTLQPDGKKIPVEKDAIRTTGDNLSSGAPMFSETKHKVVVYPNVK